MYLTLSMLCGEFIKNYSYVNQPLSTVLNNSNRETVSHDAIR